MQNQFYFLCSTADAQNWPLIVTPRRAATQHSAYVPELQSSKKKTCWENPSAIASFTINTYLRLENIDTYIYFNLNSNRRTEKENTEIDFQFFHKIRRNVPCDVQVVSPRPFSFYKINSALFFNRFFTLFFNENIAVYLENRLSMNVINLSITSVCVFGCVSHPSLLFLLIWSLERTIVSRYLP